VRLAPTIGGPWSEPVPLGPRGFDFDFSFFHDTDGTHWMVGVQWDHRPEHPSFSGLVIEQYLPAERRAAGEVTVIYREAGLVEGPNIPAPPGPLILRAVMEGPDLDIFIDGVAARKLAGTYPAWKLSDDHGERLRFTGAFRGVRAEDLDGSGWSADVDTALVRFALAD
jgi:beta-xylosidase